MQDHEDCARVCRVLAAQLTEVQARFETASGTLIATLGQLEATVAAEMAADGGGAATALQDALDSLLFAQAQEHDLIRQMMAAVVQALSLLPDGIDTDRLPELYVTEAQRTVHAVALAAAAE
ncbi:hypothetical protein [Azospirillum soli]|uniref:hypothetical protein n=1 Tax=Azospirillum soli TaxID=1304799 RepID=UPI001AE94A5B|nr:hypothetical protein [Azospirillum soli]MBP2314284.1 hypothetical protein [Azospirillum soli]